MQTRSGPNIVIVAGLTLFYGVGFALFLLSLLEPSLFQRWAWLTWVVNLWGFAIFAGVGFLIYRLKQTTAQAALRRKNRYDSGWREVEARKARGQRVREASYQRARMLTEAQEAQRRAELEAAALEGVKVQFRYRDNKDD